MPLSTNKNTPAYLTFPHLHLPFSNNVYDEDEVMIVILMMMMMMMMMMR